MERKDAWQTAMRRIADPVTRELALCGTVRLYAKGELLVREGDSGEALFILLAGRVKVFVGDGQGRELVLGHYGARELLGEMALDGRPRTASIRALEPTACSVVERTVLLAALRRDPEVGLRLLGTLASRARRATDSLKELALMDVYGRVARLLLAQEFEAGADGRLWSRERLTQQEIADRVGASRDMISRILKDLRTGGYIAVREKRFTILRRPPARW